jgi:hypothetical protein
MTKNLQGSVPSRICCFPDDGLDWLEHVGITLEHSLLYFILLCII